MLEQRKVHSVTDGKEVTRVTQQDNSLSDIFKAIKWSDIGYWILAIGSLICGVVGIVVAFGIK